MILDFSRSAFSIHSPPCINIEAMERIFICNRKSSTVRPNLPQMLQVNFDHCAIESVPVWFNRCRHFRKVIKSAGTIIGAPLPDITKVYTHSIIRDSPHQAFYLFNPLPSGKKRSVQVHKDEESFIFPSCSQAANQSSPVPFSLFSWTNVSDLRNRRIVFDCNIWTFTYWWFTITFLTDNLLFPPVLCWKWLNKNKTFSPSSICLFSFVDLDFVWFFIFFYSYLVSLCKSDLERGRREAKYISDPVFWHFIGHGSAIKQLFINGKCGRNDAALPRTTDAPPSC